MVRVPFLTSQRSALLIALTLTCLKFVQIISYECMRYSDYHSQCVLMIVPILQVQQ